MFLYWSLLLVILFLLESDIKDYSKENLLDPIISVVVFLHFSHALLKKGRNWEVMPMKTVSMGQVFSRFSSRLWRGFLGTFFSLLFPPVFQLPFPSVCHCLQSIGQVIIFPFMKVVFEAIYLKLGLKPTWQGLCAMLNHSVVSDWNLSPGKPHRTWF